MTKKEILEKLKKMCQEDFSDVFNKTQNEKKLCDIEFKLRCFPDNYPFGTISSINKYLDTNFPPEVSLNKILTEIDSELSKIIKERVNVKERETKYVLDAAHHKGMFIFIAFILLFVAVAIVCIVAGIFVTEGSTADKVLEKLATTFGYADFALGAIGFVWERIEDTKIEAHKDEVHEKAEAVKTAHSAAEIVESVQEFAKVVEIKNSHNVTKQKGKINVAVNGDINGEVNIGASLFN